MNRVYTNQIATHSVPIPVEHKTSPLAERVGGAAFRVFFGVVWTFIATLSVVTVIPAAVIITKKIRSHFKLKKTIQAMAKNRYDTVKAHMQELSILDLKEMTLSNFKEGSTFVDLKGFEDLSGDESLKKGYLRQVFQLIKMVEEESAPNNDLHAHMQKFRGKLDKLLSHPIYVQNKNKKDNFFVKVLLEAAHALVAESSGIVPMQDLGEEVVGNCSESLSYESFAKVLEKAAKKHAEFRKDSKIQKIFWSFSHPQKAYAACMDATGAARPTSYNSFRHGNASIKVGEFTVKNVTYSLSQSPTFTCDRVTEAARDRGDKRIVQDIEEVDGPKGEKKRVEAKKARANKNLGGKGGKILHVHTPVDIHGQKSADAFGLDQKLVSAIENALGKNEKAKAVAFAALKGIQTLVDQADIVEEKTVYFNQSCKQNIDRGVAVNVATILLADAINGEKLTQERIHQLVGMVLTRAEMVDDRAILEKRLRPLLDFIKAMGSDRNLISAVQDYFGSGAVSFK